MRAFMQWLHVVAAAIAVGGTAFLWMILLPSLRPVDASARAQVMQGVLEKFRLTVWIVIAVLMVSGIYNLATADHLDDPTYRRVLVAKILLAIALFAIALGLTLPTPMLAGFQKQRPRWLAVNVALGLLIILLAAYLRRI